METKTSTKRVFVGPNLFCQNAPIFFPKKGIEWYLYTLLCWINKLTDSYYWYFLLILASWHPDLMAIVIGSGSWSLTFWWKHASLAMKNMWGRLHSLILKKRHVSKKKHRSETVWTETLHVLYSRLVLCCCQHRDFFQSADIFIAEDVSRNIPLPFGLTILFYGQGFQKQCASFSLVSHHNQPIVAVIGGLGWWLGFLGSPNSPFRKEIPGMHQLNISWSLK